MTSEIKEVSFFRTEAFSSFWQPKEGEECIPLLAIACFFDIAQNVNDFVWKGVVDFGKVGETMCRLTNYWEITDCLKNLFFSKDTVAVCALKVFSNLVNFTGALIQLSILKGLNIHPVTLIGSISGSIECVHKLYHCFTDQGPEDIQDIPKDIPDINGRKASDIYRTQHAWSLSFKTLTTVSILAIKVISLFGAVCAIYGMPPQTFYVASTIMKLVIDHKEKLLFSSFVTFTTGAIMSHFSKEQMEEQMEEFKGQNRQIGE